MLPKTENYTEEETNSRVDKKTGDACTGGLGRSPASAGVYTGKVWSCDVHRALIMQLPLCSERYSVSSMFTCAVARTLLLHCS